MTLTSLDEICQAINVFLPRVDTHCHELALPGLSAVHQEQVTIICLLALGLLKGRAWGDASLLGFLREACPVLLVREWAP